MTLPKMSALTVLLLLVFGCASQAPLKPNMSVVLSANEQFLRLFVFCSRPGPPEFEGTWTPSPQQIADMELQFPRLLRQRAKQCCIIGERVEDVNEYVRQYFGIVVDGRKLIYINAVDAEGAEFGPPTASIADYCDGGSCCWGALYDPETKRFSGLAFNGIA